MMRRWVSATPATPLVTVVMVVATPLRLVVTLPRLATLVAPRVPLKVMAKLVVVPTEWALSTVTATLPLPMPLMPDRAVWILAAMVVALLL